MFGISFHDKTLADARMSRNLSKLQPVWPLCAALESCVVHKYSFVSLRDKAVPASGVFDVILTSTIIAAKYRKMHLVHFSTSLDTYHLFSDHASL